MEGIHLEEMIFRILMKHAFDPSEKQVIGIRFKPPEGNGIEEFGMEPGIVEIGNITYYIDAYHPSLMKAMSYATAYAAAAYESSYYFQKTKEMGWMRLFLNEVISLPGKRLEQPRTIYAPFFSANNLPVMEKEKRYSFKAGNIIFDIRSDDDKLAGTAMNLAASAFETYRNSEKARIFGSMGKIIRGSQIRDIVVYRN